MKYDDSTPTKARTTITESSTVKETVEDSVGDNYRGYNRNFPPSWTMNEKMSKETAEYQQGMPFANCGKCTYYQSGHCKVVRGMISPGMWCKYFSEKYTPVMSISIVKRR